MNETTGASPAGIHDERPDGTVTGGSLHSIVDIFVDPGKVFHRIRAGAGWWQPYLFTTVIGVVLGWLSLPINRRVMELNERGIAPEQLDAMLENIDRFGWLGLIAVPIVYLLILAVMGGIVHLVISMISSEAGFKRTMSLLAWCGLISILGQIIRVAIILSRGVETIEFAADARISLSLAAFLPEAGGFGRALLETFLSAAREQGARRLRYPPPPLRYLR